MPMSKDDQARKGRELLAEAVPFLLQSDHDEDDIANMVHDLVGDWEEGATEMRGAAAQVDPRLLDIGIVRDPTL